MNSVGTSRALGALAIALTAAAGQAQVYSSSPALALPVQGTAQDTISVSGGPSSITDLNVILNITHTYDGDLDIILVPPSGNTYIHLTSDNGGLGDNYTGTRLDQQASNSITTGVAPFNNTFSPEGGDIDWRAAATIPLPGPSLADLSALTGTDVNGTWTLIIDDDASGDSGTLNYWSLEVNGAEDPNGPAAPPSGTGAASVAQAVSGDQVLFTVDTEVGTNPPAAISSVTIDLSDAGGSPTEALFDNGSNGDAVAGDGTYSLSYTVPAAAIRGDYSFEFTVTDASSRTGTGTIDLGIEQAPGSDQFSEVYPSATDAGDAIASAAQVTGDGALTAILGALDPSDADIFAINICDPANFSATTYPQVAGGLADSQLFLFDANGAPIVHNDDIPDAQTGSDTAMSSLTNTFVSTLPAGTYYIAVSGYNHDPVDAAGGLFWTNTPFNTERAPNGPAAGGTLAAWVNTTANEGRYTLNLTGTCFVVGGGSTCPGCAADYDQDGGVTGGDIGAFFSDFEQGLPCADVDQDGGVTGGDIGAFFQVFEAGGC